MLRDARFTWSAITVLALAAAVRSIAAPTPEEIMQKSVAATEADWREAPAYAFINREVASKHGSTTVKTYEVTMIEGSQYNRLVALNDRPLSPGEREEEARKLQQEIYKRQHESNRERNRRIAKYRKERDQDHAMTKEMANAFEFKLIGEERMDGRDTWVLDASPKPGYAPPNHEARVLTGMRGKLWVDQATYQWVKVEAQVVRPVSFFGFLARVGPGTRFELEQRPVREDLWLPAHFGMKVNATALGFISENSAEDDTYRDYRPSPAAAVADIQSTQ